MWKPQTKFSSIVNTPIQNQSPKSIDGVTGDVNTQQCAHASWHFLLFFAWWCPCTSWFVQGPCFWNSRNISYSGSARFHRLTPHKGFEPMFRTIIMAVCSLFSRLLLSTDLITVHLLLCRAQYDNRLYPQFSWMD